MSLFKASKERNFTVIVGCGRLGANLANTLSDAGESVLIIDNVEDAFRKLSPYFGGISLVGDATEIFVLEEANIKSATAVITVTNDDNTNILVAQLAKEYFGVEHVISRLYDPERECVYHEFNIYTICPAVLSAREIALLLNAKKSTEASE